MEASRIDVFMTGIMDKVTPQHAMLIRERLETVSDDDFGYLQSLPYKNPMMILVISVLLGPFGIDRFMLGDTGLGVLKLITCGGFGIWTLIDWFLVMDKAKTINYELFMRNVR